MPKPAGKDETLILALASGLTAERAARKAGLSRRTAFRRLEDPAFRTRVTAARGEMTDRAVGRLAHAYSQAARALLKLLNSDRDSVRLGAARAILELGPKLKAGAELEERLARLEAELERREREERRREPFSP